MEWLSEAMIAYRLRWKRRRLLYRALRKRRQLSVVFDRTAQIAPGDVLGAMTVRNEIARLPYFFSHHRALGVQHFLVVDNGSDDGTEEYLAQQSDVSLWRTEASYKQSRFGMYWLNWLQLKYAHDHWCLTLDADEVFIYPHYDTRPLQALVNWLESEDRISFGALMLDMYPKGDLSSHRYKSGDNPFRTLCWFDSGNYVLTKKQKLQNLSIQGGVRFREFFGFDPERAPTMSKTPLVKWNRRFAYVSSTHSLLPRRLNHVYDETGGELASGVLLHTKFLPIIIDKSEEEKRRGEHFASSSLYNDYYDAVMNDPDLWCSGSTKYTGWRQLESLGLMSRGGWV